MVMVPEVSDFWGYCTKYQLPDRMIEAMLSNMPLNGALLAAEFEDCRDRFNRQHRFNRQNEQGVEYHLGLFVLNLLGGSFNYAEWSMDEVKTIFRALIHSSRTDEELEVMMTLATGDQHGKPVISIRRDGTWVMGSVLFMDPRGSSRQVIA